MRSLAGVLLAIVVGAVGCATTGGPDQTQASLARMNRQLNNIEADLNEVRQLNETLAALNARVDNAESASRRSQGVAEENQVKIDTLQSRLDDLTRTMYNQYGLTPPSGAGQQQTQWQTPVPDDDDVLVDEDDIRIDVGGAGAALAPLDIAGSAQPAGSPIEEYQRAQQVFMAEDFEQALALYDRFLRQFPDHEYAHNAQFWKAEAFFKMNDFQEAISEYQRLRSNYPNSDKIPTAMYNQAVAHLREGQQSQAYQLLEELQERYPMSRAAEGAQEAMRQLGQT